MKISSCKFLFALVILFLACLAQVHGDDSDDVTCTNTKNPCFLKPMKCPKECPKKSPKDSKAKACYFDNNSPICKAQCKDKKPNCDGPGAACHDPRFIGGDGIVFYFHGKKNEHFTLVSDPNLQINARFIGLRPVGRFRDFTWIQALGFLFGENTFSIESAKAEKWDNDVDHLKFSYNGQEIVIPQQYQSVWESSEKSVSVERTSRKNSVLVIIPGVAEISVNVVPITKEDDRIHNYQIPSDDCFAHLEVQFKFYGFSEKVEGVLGRTYRPDFVNPAKPGVAMAVVGGEDKYRTSSLLGTNCARCIFFPYGHSAEHTTTLVQPAKSFLDCASGSKSGYGIVCRK